MSLVPQTVYHSAAVLITSLCRTCQWVRYPVYNEKSVNNNPAGPESDTLTVLNMVMVTGFNKARSYMGMVSAQEK